MICLIATNSARTGEASLAFTYNGMDDRVSEVRGTTTRRYVYDGSGRVLGEYGASATDVAAEYLWLSRIHPVSTVFRRLFVFDLASGSSMGAVH